MSTRDPRIDAYIAKSASFAQPILRHLRELVHSACPEVEETMKWSHPHFQYHGIMCGMASFKEHCSFGFWKSSLILENGEEPKEGMGSFGRLTEFSDLPTDAILTGYIHKAMKLNEDGVKSPTRPKPKPKVARELIVPDDLAAQLAGNSAALATFEGFSPSQKREYVDWITEAKTQATRSKRLETAIAWMAEGKKRNWKYMNC